MAAKGQAPIKGMSLASLECIKHKSKSPEGMREKHLRALWAIRRELYTIEAKVMMHADVQPSDIIVFDSGYQVDGLVVEWCIEHAECGPGFINVFLESGNRRESIK